MRYDAGYDASNLSDNFQPILYQPKSDRLSTYHFVSSQTSKGSCTSKPPPFSETIFTSHKTSIIYLSLSHFQHCNNIRTFALFAISHCYAQSLVRAIVRKLFAKAEFRALHATPQRAAASAGTDTFC